MADVLLVVGLVLALEGGLYAAFPGGMKRMMAIMLQQPDDALRISGLGAATEAAAQTARVDLEQQILGPQLLDAVGGGGQLTVPLRMGQHRPVARRADFEERLFQAG